MSFRVQSALAVVVILTVGGGHPNLVSAHDDMRTHEQAHARDGVDVPGERGDVTVEIAIRSEGYQLRREGKAVGQELSLIAGRPTVFALRNDDDVVHDFISALFTRIEVRFTGRATGIFRKDAAGFRLNPGDSLTLRFIAPFSEFRSMYDLIWCTHNSDHSPERKELLIVVTEEKPRGS
jgi:hypothetical protein